LLIRVKKGSSFITYKQLLRFFVPARRGKATQNVCTHHQVCLTLEIVFLFFYKCLPRSAILSRYHHQISVLPVLQNMDAINLKTAIEREPGPLQVGFITFARILLSKPGF
jgi:hypothetical protein